MSRSGSAVRKRCVHLPIFAPGFSVHRVGLATRSSRELWNHTDFENFGVRTFRCACLQPAPPVADPSTQNSHPSFGYLAPALHSNWPETHPVPAAVFDSPGFRWPPPRMARWEKAPTSHYCEWFPVLAFRWLKSLLASRYNYQYRSLYRKNSHPEMAGYSSF